MIASPGRSPRPPRTRRSRSDGLAKLLGVTIPTRVAAGSRPAPGRRDPSRAAPWPRTCNRAGLHEHVELAAVEVLKEAHGRGQHDEVAEHDADRKQHGDRGQQRQRARRSLGANAGRMKPPSSNRTTGSEITSANSRLILERHGERLADSERHRFVAFGHARDLRHVGPHPGDLCRQRGARPGRETARGRGERGRETLGAVRQCQHALLGQGGLAERPVPLSHLLLVCSSSGLLSTCSSAWFCHMHTAKATASTARSRSAASAARRGGPPGQLILVADRADGGGHGPYEASSAPFSGDRRAACVGDQWTASEGAKGTRCGRRLLADKPCLPIATPTSALACSCPTNGRAQATPAAARRRTRPPRPISCTSASTARASSSTRWTGPRRAPPLADRAALPGVRVTARGRVRAVDRGAPGR